MPTRAHAKILVLRAYKGKMWLTVSDEPIMVALMVVPLH